MHSFDTEQAHINIDVPQHTNQTPQQSTIWLIIIATCQIPSLLALHKSVGKSCRFEHLFKKSANQMLGKTLSTREDSQHLRLLTLPSQQILPSLTASQRLRPHRLLVLKSQRLPDLADLVSLLRDRVPSYFSWSSQHLISFVFILWYICTSSMSHRRPYIVHESKASNTLGQVHRMHSAPAAPPSSLFAGGPSVYDHSLWTSG